MSGQESDYLTRKATISQPSLNSNLKNDALGYKSPASLQSFTYLPDINKVRVQQVDEFRLFSN